MHFPFLAVIVALTAACTAVSAQCDQSNQPCQVDGDCCTPMKCLPPPVHVFMRASYNEVAARVTRPDTHSSRLGEDTIRFTVATNIDGHIIAYELLEGILLNVAGAEIVRASAKMCRNSHGVNHPFDEKTINIRKSEKVS
ncbi:uncharacterized protein F5891DRAFT_979045 [Suillus fuscotomentosus]|uniref:Uncharacterized protein n=1 Tax=Suillus fuscotomentosus TaxID=1912939 RepID=A0AAD4HLC6_9AGAM|nr:uncharacterized protein F5891DRAFT_979045 [Suillus fuscotomentosus]KAG1901920.1 hypothetical protein F5891DRAFT_979045 [Suillus fuscotomentosus]